jgi:hypothetical protein
MENPNAPKPEDVIKDSSKEDKAEGTEAPSILSIHGGLLGIEGFGSDPGETSEEEKEKKDKKKRKKDSPASLVVPRPDLVAADPSAETEKTWSTKVLEYFGLGSAEETPAGGRPNLLETLGVLPAQENPDERVKPPAAAMEERPATGPDHPSEIDEPVITHEPVHPAPLSPDTGGGSGESPPEEPPLAEVRPPRVEPEPEATTTILARRAAEATPAMAASPVETGPAPITNNYYLRQRSDLLPALVVDQLSRRRDRKLRRHNRAQDKSANVLKQQVDNLSARVAREQDRSTEQATKVPVAEAVSAPTAERPLPRQEHVAARAPERSSQAIFERRGEYAEKLNRPEKETPPVSNDAERVKKVVEAAAEAAIPIEMLYEQRHEMKGNEDFSAAADAAIQRKSSIFNNEISETNSRNIEQQINIQSTPANPASKPHLYSQAAKGGAMAALAFIIAFLVLYFLLLKT